LYRTLVLKKLVVETAQTANSAISRFSIVCKNHRPELTEPTNPRQTEKSSSLH
jgi:hypothetical protein